MEVKVKRLPKSRVQVLVEVPAERMADFFDSVYRSLSKTVEIPGFRPGFAPKSMVLERVGNQRLIAQAVDEALPETYSEAMTQVSLIPIAEPTIEVKSVAEGEKFIYEATVDVLPEVNLGNYRRLKVVKKKFGSKPVLPKEIDEVVEQMRKMAATPKPIDRGASTGDWLEINFSGSVDGVQQERLKSQNHPLILGEGTFQPEFEKALLGIKKGELREFSLNLQSGENKTQKVDFSVKALQVSELVLPALDEKFARDIKKDSVEQIRAELKTKLTKERQLEADRSLETAVLDALIKETKIDLPDSLVEREISRRTKEITEQLKHAGRTFEDWLKHQKKTADEFKKEMWPEAARGVKLQLILREVADSEGFESQENEPNSARLMRTLKFLVETIAK